MARPGEFELIERFFAPLASEGSFAMKDDAALLRIPDGRQIVITQDAIAANIHFLPDDPPDTIAQKALRVNLSDLAAKGAVPHRFSLALGLPPDWTEDWLAEFAKGLTKDCANYGISLTGGDTFRVEAGPVISITAIGLIGEDSYASRQGARAGDELFVTGRVGEGALGFLVRTGKLSFDREADDFLRSRYLVPQPPVGFANAIAAHASAAIDISDGFAGDLAKLAAASGMDFRIRLADIPLARALNDRPGDEKLIGVALSGGDDYQIAFTAPPDSAKSLHSEAYSAGIELNRLCAVEPGRGNVLLIGSDDMPLSLESGSYSHF